MRFVLLPALLVVLTSASHAAVYAGHQTSSEASNQTVHRLDVGALAIEPGDLLVAHLCVDGGGGTTVECPAGWTEVEHSDSAVVGAICVKQAAPSDSEIHEVTFSTSRAQQSQSGVVLVRGHDPSNPIDASASTPRFHRSPASPGLRAEPESLVLQFMCANAGQATEGVGFPNSVSRALWLLESADGSSGPVTGGAAVGTAAAAVWTDALAIPQDSIGFSLAVRSAPGPTPREQPVPDLVADHQTSAESGETTRHTLAADSLEVSEGDLLVAHICVDGGRGVGIACPPGWERALADENGGVAGALCTRHADANDARAASFSFSTTRPEQSQSGLLVLDGAHPVSPLEAADVHTGTASTSPVSPALPEAPEATSSVLRFLCADGGTATEGVGFPSDTSRNLWLLESDDGLSGPVTGGAAIDAPGAADFAIWEDALTASVRSVNFTVAVRPADSRGWAIADAGADVVVDDVGADGTETVLLDGSASHASNGAIVAWTWVAGTRLLGAGETLLAAFPLGVHEVLLQVEDTVGHTATDTVAVTVVPGDGQSPVADAGPDQSLLDRDRNGFESVTLDGSGSLDVDGVVVDWTWTEGGSPIAAGERAAVSLAVGVHTVTLTVQDDQGNRGVDTVEVEIRDPGSGSGSACTGSVTDPLSLYHIGHSLTDRAADLLNHLVEAETGRSVSYSYKSIPGASLYHHWLQPTAGRKGNVRSGDALQILRSGQFDALVLTETTSLDYFVPHPTRGTPEYANRWVDEFLAHTTRPDPRVYVYSTWYGRREDGPDTPESIETFLSEIERRQPLWETIAQSVRDAHPGLPVHIVPGGLVLKELQERVLDGTLVLPAGASFRDTFFKRNRPERGGCGTRDHIHLGEAGIYAIALTHHAVIHGACVEGLPASVPYSGYDDGCIERDSIDIDPALALEIQRTVMDVVNGYGWTGR